MSTINSLDDNFCSTSIETPPQVGPTDKKVGRVVYMTLLGAGIGQWCAWMASSSSYIPAALGGILGAIYTNPNLPVSETSEEFYCKIGRIFNKAVEGLFEGARFGWIAAVSSDIVCQVPWVVTPPPLFLPVIAGTASFGAIYGAGISIYNLATAPASEISKTPSTKMKAVAKAIGTFALDTLQGALCGAGIGLTLHAVPSLGRPLMDDLAKSWMMRGAFLGTVYSGLSGIIAEFFNAMPSCHQNASPQTV